MKRFLIRYCGCHGRRHALREALFLAGLAMGGI